MALDVPTLSTLYDYYTGSGISAGLSDGQKYFTLNNENITIYSGAFHYFRVPREYWRDRLRKMRAAGLNTVETYIPWNLHEPQSGVYDFGNGGSDFEDFLHVEEFLKTAQEEDLFALVRAGPYICAEWEFGGLPSWILRITSSVRNSKDENFLGFVKLSKSGPIIAFQIENEYGNTGNVDLDYLQAIRQMFLNHGIKELLYTSDPPGANGAGSIPGVLQTANYNSYPKWQLDKLNSLQSNKPTMTMEYWTGWFDHWTEDHHTVSTNDYKSLLEQILDYPSSVNQYMFIGSTNFGFLNGAGSLYAGMNNSGFQPTTTSYDYDSPITEYGGYTEKYQATLEVIRARNKVTTRIPDAPEEKHPVSFPALESGEQLLLSELIDNHTERILSEDVIPMENLPINNDSGQSYGYIVYRKTELSIPANAVLKITGYVRDTVLVLINGKLVSRAPKTVSDIDGFGFWRLLDSTLTLTEEELQNATLDLVVENFGRNNYGSLSQFHQFKGLIDDVFMNDAKLTQWQIMPFEFKKSWNKALTNWHSIQSSGETPALYKFSLIIDQEPQDTFLDMREWNKGITIVNGFVLGRHFFLGPQQSLYLPKTFLKKGLNDIIVFEHYNAPRSLKFSARPIFGGPSH